MSESSEISNEQEQELRRRNINVATGEFEQKNEESKNLIESILESGSRKQSGDNNETIMDSDHVRIK